MTKSKSSQTRGSGRRTKRKSAVSLRPEHQRELFALALIAIAGVTIIFYLTGITGQLGGGWKLFIEKLLGWGALVVPLVVDAEDLVGLEPPGASGCFATGSCHHGLLPSWPSSQRCEGPRDYSQVRPDFSLGYCARPSPLERPSPIRGRSGRSSHT